MKILQLCCFTNRWGEDHEVDSYDLRLKKDIFDIHLDQLEKYDLIVAAPPCDQFTKANAHHWEQNPQKYIDIARQCLLICEYSNKPWWLENPPGRIEKLIPELTKYRLANVRFKNSNKEYIIYGNRILLIPNTKRYGHPSSKFNNMTKKQREAWHPDLVNIFKNSIQ